MLLIVSLIGLLGCYGSHRIDPETGIEYSNVGGPYGATAHMDAQGRNDLLRDAADGDVPVTVTSSTRSGDRMTTETVTVGNQYGAYGNGAMPVYVSFDPNMAQGAAYNAAFREQWKQQNGMAPPAVGGGNGGSAGNGGSVSASQVLVDPNAVCPKVGMPRNQAEMDACQNDGMGQIMTRLPVSK